VFAGLFEEKLTKTKFYVFSRKNTVRSLIKNTLFEISFFLFFPKLKRVVFNFKKMIAKNLFAK
jgi:hypothetical protein